MNGRNHAVHDGAYILKLVTERIVKLCESIARYLPYGLRHRFDGAMNGGHYAAHVGFEFRFAASGYTALPRIANCRLPQKLYVTDNLRCLDSGLEVV